MEVYIWYLATDAETGGTNPQKNPLFTAYFAVCDENLDVIDELYLYLKPDDWSRYAVEKEAMDITGIDLKKHCEVAITYSAGKKVLMDFLNKHKIKGKRKHFRPLGQNVDFDLNFYKAQLIDEEEWHKLVDYKTLDTLRICTFMQDIGLMPSDVGNLGSLVEYFGVKKREAHEAKDDVLMTIDVYRKMKEIFKSNSLLVSMSSDLLSVLEG